MLYVGAGVGDALDTIDDDATVLEAISDEELMTDVSI